MKSSESAILNVGSKRCFTITTHSFLLYRHHKNEFSEILESFWRILELFSGKKKDFRKNFRPCFGNNVAKPNH